MGAENNSQTITHRHRYGDSSHEENHQYAYGEDKVSSTEDIFDREISTLDINKNEETKHILENNLPHEEELKKLKEIGAKTPILPSQIGTDFNYKRQIVWFNAIGFAVLHFMALVGILLTFLGIPNYKTTVYCK